MNRPSLCKHLIVSILWTKRRVYKQLETVPGGIQDWSDQASDRSRSPRGRSGSQAGCQSAPPVRVDQALRRSAGPARGRRVDSRVVPILGALQATCIGGRGRSAVSVVGSDAPARCDRPRRSGWLGSLAFVGAGDALNHLHDFFVGQWWAAVGPVPGEHQFKHDVEVDTAPEQVTGQ